MNFVGDLMGVRQFQLTPQVLARYANALKVKKLTCFFCGKGINEGENVVSRQSKDPDGQKGHGLPKTRRVLYHKTCAELVLII